MSPKVIIVILNWNGRKYLEQFLPSVLSSTYPNYTVVVADNGSTDDSIAYLRSNISSVQIIELGKNYGFAKGYNEALKQLSADYFILLNSDVEVKNEWIEPVIQLMEADKSIGVCQPKILTYNDRGKFEYAGAAGGWLDYLGYPFARGRIFDICETDEGQYDSVEPVFWATGAAMFVRAKLYKDLNGLDEFFFAHQEEIDLCWRIQLAGYKIYSCPASVVYHVGGGTLPKGNSKKTYLNFRNNRIMLSKNLPFSKKITVIPVRYVLDAASALKGLLSGDGGYFLAVIKAHFGFLGWWLFHRKKSPFPVTKNKPLAGYLNRNIAWLYFVKKKKHFSEIADKTI